MERGQDNIPEACCVPFPEYTELLRETYLSRFVPLPGFQEERASVALLGPWWQCPELGSRCRQQPNLLFWSPRTSQHAPFHLSLQPWVADDLTMGPALEPPLSYSGQALVLPPQKWGH